MVRTHPLNMGIVLDGQFGAIICLEEHPVDPIFDVVFGQSDWPVSRICVAGLFRDFSGFFCRLY